MFSILYWVDTRLYSCGGYQRLHGCLQSSQKRNFLQYLEMKITEELSSMRATHCHLSLSLDAF